MFPPILSIVGRGHRQGNRLHFSSKPTPKNLWRSNTLPLFTEKHLALAQQLTLVLHRKLIRIHTYLLGLSYPNSSGREIPFSCLSDRVSGGFIERPGSYSSKAFLAAHVHEIKKGEYWWTNGARALVMVINLIELTWA